MKIGDKIQIGKNKFDVLKIVEEVDFWDSKKDMLIGEHLEIELHLIGSSSIRPTHILKIYHDKKNNAVLLEIVHEKPPKELGRIRGNIFSYKNEKKIPVKNIKNLK